MPTEHETQHDAVEQTASRLESVRSWVSKSWRIVLLMIKGSYLLGERKMLLTKLGDAVYRQKLSGEWKPEDFNEIVTQIDKLQKKIGLEEILINRLRFGKHRLAEGKAT